MNGWVRKNAPETVSGFLEVRQSLKLLWIPILGPKFYCFAKLQCVCKEGYLLGSRSIHRPTADLETLHAILAVIVVRGICLDCLMGMVWAYADMQCSYSVELGD